MELKPQTAPINPVQRLFAVNYADSKLPTFKENKGKGIVNYGQLNDYPDKLVELSNRSPKHAAILRRKVKFIIGKETLAGGQPITQWNRYDTVKEFKNKIIYDKKTIGALAVEVLYDRTGRPSFYHIDVTKIRTLDHSCYQYWPDGKNTKQGDIKHYEVYDPLKKEIDPETGHFKPQIFYFREYRPQMAVYALPDYVGAIQYIEVDTRIANFHLNNITNGFTGGTLLQLFKDEPTHEEAKATKKAFKNNYQGDDAAETGGLIIQFNRNNEPKAEISALTPNNLDQMYLQLNETVQEEIFVGHGVTSPMLFGVKTEGQLGGRNEMLDAYEIYYKDSIEPEQQEIDAIMTMFWNDAGNKGEIETVKSEPLGQDYVALFQAGLVDKETAQEAMGLPITKTAAPVKMSDQNPFNWSDDITIYSEFGESADNYEPVPDEYASKKPEKVLAVIKGNPKATVEQIAKAVETDTTEAEKILQKLKDDGKIEWTGNKISITDKGNSGIGEIVLRYKYAESPEALPLIGESRPFCQKLIALNRLYTREDIDTMSARLGYDVWQRRGGWYTVPDSVPPLHLPHCRHEFRQVIVRRKS